MEDISFVGFILSCHVGSGGFSLMVGIRPQTDDLRLTALDVIALTAVPCRKHTGN